MIHRLVSYVAICVCIAWIIATPGIAPIVALCGLLLPMLSREYHTIIGLHILSITPKDKPIANLQHRRYSFVRPEYVNPLILADLEGWLSDSGDQVVAVNVTDSNSSNRYFATSITDNTTDTTDRATDIFPIITATDERTTERYSYQWLGCSLNGIHLLRTWSSGGGSGVFCGIMLVTVTEEAAIAIGTRGITKRGRFTIKKIAYIPLEDRYEGTLTYRFKCLLTVGACPGLATARKAKQRLVIL